MLFTVYYLILVAQISFAVVSLRSISGSRFLLNQLVVWIFLVICGALMIIFFVCYHPQLIFCQILFCCIPLASCSCCSYYNIIDLTVTMYIFATYEAAEIDLCLLMLCCYQVITHYQQAADYYQGEESNRLILTLIFLMCCLLLSPPVLHCLSCSCPFSMFWVSQDRLFHSVYSEDKRMEIFQALSQLAMSTLYMYIFVFA